MKKFTFLTGLMIAAMLILSAGLSAQNYSGGSGTEADPYQIANKADLKYLSENSGEWSKHFKQTAGITFFDADFESGGDFYNSGAGFIPIGNNSNHFTGSYNGQNYTIDNLFINRPNTHYIGLFGYTYYAPIENLGVTNIDITGDNYTGALIGDLGGSVSNCYSTGNVSGSEIIGGLIGNAYGGSVSGSYSSCTVTGSYDIGGLIGENSNSIENCYSTGGVDGDYEVGGLVGSNHSGTISQSYSSGSVSSDYDIAGGLIGMNESASIENCYSTSDLTVESLPCGKKGAFIGLNESGGNISYCYATGDVVYVNGGDPTDKGFVGEELYGSPTYNNNFFDKVESNQSTATGATGKTTAEMTNVRTFTDVSWSDGLDAAWDFTGDPYDDASSNDYWSVDGSNNNGYPWLSFQDYGPVSTNWQGDDDTSPTDWSVAENWALGTVPTVSNNVTIPDGSNDPVIGTDVNAICNDLTVNSGATLTIESNGSGTGSLIVKGTSSGYITVKRFLTDNSWHLVTPSTTNITANDFYWNDAPKSWLAFHTESDNSWTYNTDLTTPMPVGQGWSVWLDDVAKSDATATMTGDLRTTDLTLGLDYTDASHGFNLVGNPFTSAIDYHSGSWDLTNLEGTIWVWQNSSDQYLYRTQAGGGTMNGIIPVSQGFFVRAEAASPSLTIPANARTHNSQAFYKNANSDNNYESYMTIRSSYDIAFDEVWISFGTNGTYGFDNGYDASKFFGGESAPQMYLREQSKKLSIDHLPLLDENGYTVKMSYVAGEDGQQALVANLELLPDIQVTLEDLFADITQNLNNNPVYSFSANKNDNPDRFLIHFKSNEYGIDKPSCDENENITIYSHDKRIIIHSQGKAASEKGSVIICNLLGQTVIEQEIDAETLISIPIKTHNNYIIVKVIKPSGFKTEKIFIQ